jgi:hypothetical protein
MTRSLAPRPNINLRALPVLALAGRAVLTFRNLESGSHFTVKIRQKHDKKDRKIKLPAYNVEISLLGDGETRFRYSGMIFTDKPQLRGWVARTVKPGEQLDRVFRWLLGAIVNPEVLRGKVGLFHEDKCCCCGLPLTHPESIYTAMGPVCLKRKEAELAGKNIVVADLFEQVSTI